MATLTDENQVSMKALLEAGAHFGHRVSNWDPRMKRYIFMKRKGVHIIDLQKTVLLFDEALNYVKNVAAAGGRMLLVGTKKQASTIIEENAKRIGEFYITTRWIGGLLTNMKTVKHSTDKLKNMREVLADPEKQSGNTKKELMKMRKKMMKMEESLGGVIGMETPPDLIFAIDAHHESNCIREANLVGVPICAVVDTNSNPENIDLVIPANDDAIRSIALFVESICNAFAEGKAYYRSTRLDAEMLKDEGEQKVDINTEKKTETTENLQKSASPTPPPSSQAVNDRNQSTKHQTTNIKTERTNLGTENSEPQKGKVNEAREETPPQKNNSEGFAQKQQTSTTSSVMPPKSNETVEPTSEKAENSSADQGKGNAEIGAAMVKELRERSGAKMMDCKRALVETQGDMEKAIRLLRETGMATMNKKAGRNADDGLVSIAGDFKKRAILTLACETDFVAKNENFKKLADSIAARALVNGEAEKNSQETINAIADITTKLGEKIEPLSLETMEADNGYIGSYVHGNGKIGVLVKLKGKDNSPVEDSSEIKELAMDLCLQIAAMSPIAVTSEEISEETRESEKAIFMKQLENEGKPKEILEKIVEGKLKKHFAEACLLEMPFVKDSKVKVSERVDAVAKKLGIGLSVESFKRLQIGNA